MNVFDRSSKIRNFWLAVSFGAAYGNGFLLAHNQLAGGIVTLVLLMVVGGRLLWRKYQ